MFRGTLYVTYFIIYPKVCFNLIFPDLLLFGSTWYSISISLKLIMPASK